MPTAIFSALEDGLIFAIMALGVYLSFRILDFPDLTVEGSFVTGAAVAATLIVSGVSPIIATILAIIIGFFVGCLTGLIHTIGKVNALLSGIIMMIGMYSINFRIMGSKPNVPLLGETTLFIAIKKIFEPLGIDKALNNIWINVGFGKPTPTTWATIFVLIILVILVKFILDRFLKTEIGLALRATGDNKKMIRSFSANTNLLIILGLGLSNALVAFAGSLFAQNSMTSSLGLGNGMIIVGLASVIIGEALFGKSTITRTTLSVIGGAITYKLIIALVLRSDILTPNDTKLITAIIVLLALVTPKIIENFNNKKFKEKSVKKFKKRSLPAIDNGGDADAAVKENI